MAMNCTTAENTSGILAAEALAHRRTINGARVRLTRVDSASAAPTSPGLMPLILTHELDKSPQAGLGNKKQGHGRQAR